MKKKVNLPSKLFLDKEAILTLNEINGGIIYDPGVNIPSPVKSVMVCTYARDGAACAFVSAEGGCSWYHQDCRNGNPQG